MQTSLIEQHLMRACSDDRDRVARPHQASAAVPAMPDAALRAADRRHDLRQG